jgi:hypothetical protein
MAGGRNLNHFDPWAYLTSAPVVKKTIHSSIQLSGNLCQKSVDHKFDNLFLES